MSQNTYIHTYIHIYIYIYFFFPYYTLVFYVHAVLQVDGIQYDDLILRHLTAIESFCDFLVLIEGLNFSTTMDHYTSRYLTSCIRSVLIATLQMFLHHSAYTQLIFQGNHLYRLIGNQSHLKGLLKFLNSSKVS